MEPGETVLSDVHVHHKAVEPECSTTFTQFEFTIGSSEEPQFDADGDLVVERTPSLKNFEIEHCMSTTLDAVGLQVWNGSLIMCDFILSNENLFKDQIVVELGCGVGLTAIFAGFCGAKMVFATDINEEALQICGRNVERNSAKIGSCNICPKFFDWDTKSFHDVSQVFRWSKDDLSAAQNSNVMIAADVVYDSEAVGHLFQAIRHLCKRSQTHRHVIISLEKRFNFSLEQLDVVCTAYGEFSEGLEGLKKDGWKVSRLDTDSLAQHFIQFPRNPNLEIWHLETPFSI